MLSFSFYWNNFNEVKQGLFAKKEKGKKGNRKYLTVHNYFWLGCLSDLLPCAFYSYRQKCWRKLCCTWTTLLWPPLHYVTNNFRNSARRRFYGKNYVLRLEFRIGSHLPHFRTRRCTKNCWQNMLGCWGCGSRITPTTVPYFSSPLIQTQPLFKEPWCEHRN